MRDDGHVDRASSMHARKYHRELFEYSEMEGGLSGDNDRYHGIDTRSECLLFRFKYRLAGSPRGPPNRGNIPEDGCHTGGGY